MPARVCPQLLRVMPLLSLHVWYPRCCASCPCSLCSPCSLLSKLPGLLLMPPSACTQVHNALGYAFFNMDRVGPAIEQYKKAVSLQPGYVTGERTKTAAAL